MNLTETGKLLTFIAELDYRRFTEETVIAWHEVLSRYDYQDCRQAVIVHNETSTEFLKPGSIGKIIKANRKRRLNGVMDVLVSDTDDLRCIENTPQSFNQYQATVKEIREAIANGTLSRDDYQRYRRNNLKWSEFKNTLGPREPMKAIGA